MALKLSSAAVLLAPHEGVLGSKPAIWHRGRGICGSLVDSLRLATSKSQFLIVAWAAAAALATLVLVLESDEVALESVVASSPPGRLLPRGKGVGRALGFERQVLTGEPSSWALSREVEAAESGSWGRLEGWEERRRRRERRRRKRWESPGLPAEALGGGSDGSSTEGEGSREGSLPSFAYSISGYADGDGSRMARLLSVVYHPRNTYCLHLDAAAREEEMEVVRRAVSGDPLMAAAGNVFIVEKRTLVAYSGPSIVAMYLHCAAILLERRPRWDWFINLSSNDYPLATQDDLMLAFVPVPRNLSLISHFRMPRPAFYRATDIYVDESLATKKKKFLKIGIHRPLPTSFQLFKGEAWVMLSRPFVQYLILGIDAFPRILLLYMANFHVPDESYFQTVACNSPFRSTIVNLNTHYISGYKSVHANILEAKDLQAVKDSNLPFARKFVNVGVLDIIDKTFLGIVRRGHSSNERSCNESMSDSAPCANLVNKEYASLGGKGYRLPDVLKRQLDPNLMSNTQCE